MTGPHSDMKSKRNPKSKGAKMKRLMTSLVILAVVCVTNLTVQADVYVRGYYRSNGTYVSPHWRSDPDSNFWNNWSTYPNVNPYTGAVGTRRTPSYSRGYSFSCPSYNWSSPSYGDSYSWRTPSYSYPSYGGFGSSLWGW